MFTVFLYRLRCEQPNPRATQHKVGAEAAGAAPRGVHRGQQDGGTADGADVPDARGVWQVRASLEGRSAPAVMTAAHRIMPLPFGVISF